MKIGKQTFKLETKPSIEYTSSIVGPKEMQGPLKDFFDTHIEDVWDSEKSFEKCESKMLKTSINNLMQKADIKDEDVDLIFSGDLLSIVKAYKPFSSIYSLYPKISGADKSDTLIIISFK